MSKSIEALKLLHKEALLFISPLVEGIDYKYRLKIQNLINTLKGENNGTK